MSGSLNQHSFIPLSSTVSFSANNNESGKLEDVLPETKIFFDDWKDVQEFETKMWDIYEILGSGAMGTVHRVQNKETKDNYAMKIIDMEEIPERDFKWINNERHILEGVDNDHVTKLLNKYKFRGRYVMFLMEYAVFGSLRNVSENLNFKYSLTTIKDIVGQLVLGLEYIHNHNLVHRDFRPRNILITDNGQIKICDFGFSAMLDESRRQSLISYNIPTQEDNDNVRINVKLDTCPPELMDKKTYNGFALDYWGLGLIVFWLLSGGEYPFRKNACKCVGAPKQSDKEIIFSSKIEIDDSSKDIIRKLLTQDPIKRAQSFSSVEPFDIELKQKDLISFAELKKHPFFSDLNWDSLGHDTSIYTALKHKTESQTPPHIFTIDEVLYTKQFKGVLELAGSL